MTAKASSIAERLAGRFVPDETRHNDELVDARLERWCQTVAGGDRAKFQRRLAYDGLNLNTVRRALGPVRLADDQPVPSWVHTLEAVLEAAQSATRLFGKTGLLTHRDRCLDPEDPIPFEHVLLPFIRVARERLVSQAGPTYQLLSEVAHAALERHLLHDLSHISARTFLAAFSVYQTLEQRTPPPGRELEIGDWGSEIGDWRVEIGGETQQPAREHYVAFVEGLLDGGLVSFFQEYSVLGRLLATKTDFWVESTTEFLQRLEADWADIQNLNTPYSQISNLQSPISNLRSGLSDPHSNGRTVIAIEFASGLWLVYKPKDIGVERAYHNLIRWLNVRGLMPTLKPLRVIDRGTYGWVELVERRPCQNQEEAGLFYRRAGMLLTLFYILHGMDYHHENIIACGPHPTPVDHEMLMYPYLREELDGSAPAPADQDTAKLEAHRLLNRSALSTGLLPMWETNPDGQVYDISALGGIQEQKQTVRQLRWKNINTDTMARRWESIMVEASRAANRPALDGAALSLSEHRTDLIAGFRDMYRFLLEHRETILAPNGPLAEFEGQLIRFTFRKTRIYWSILEAALAPSQMRDGADRSIQLDVLSRALLSSESRPPLWPIVRAEQTALAQMDVPRFTMHTDGRALRIAGDEVIDDVFSESGYELARARLAALSEANLERQMAFIRASISSWQVSRGETRKQGNKEKREEGGRGKGKRGQGKREKGEKETRADSDSVVALTPVQMVEEAVRIAEVLRTHAICAGEGATWIHQAWNPAIRRFQLEPLGYDLYSGSAGVALFLAALSKVTGEARFRNLTLATLHPVRQAIHNSQFTIHNSQFTIGAATGLGSMIYALVRAGQFLDNDVLLQDAHRAAVLITPEHIAGDRALDIISGAAGAILGLLTLHAASPPINATRNTQYAPLERAVACGQHLLDVRITSETGLRAWPTLEGKLLTGFSHGAAGIAYALLRLYQATGEAAFRDAAEEGIAYEQSVFSPQAGNWPDFRTSTLVEPSFFTTWCHGAPGIGLARLGSLGVLNTAEIRADIEVALKTTLDYGVRGVDHLCCGSLGRAELLLEAADRLSRSDLLETGRRWASTIVVRAEETGGYNLRPQLSDGAFSPGFFQGLAGVGYALLRLAYPDQVPSVLLWE